MRFDYQYRTRENELKSGSISASSRDEAFRLLKANGINPARMELSRGFGNRLASLGKRGWAIVLLVISLSATIAYIATGRPGMRTVVRSDVDPEVLDRLEKSGLDVAAISALLNARQRANELYRLKIEDDVKRGKLTHEAADEMLSAAGLAR